MSGEPSREEWRQGRRRLRELLPWARAEARRRAATDEHTFKSESGLGDATFCHVREDNLDALIVHAAVLGGWDADLALKNVPLGVPNVMGSPVATPYRTKQEAEEAAKTLLVAALLIGIMKPPPGPPVFLFFGWTIPLRPEIYEAARKLGIRPGYGSKQAAMGRIDEIVAELGIAEPFDMNEFQKQAGKTVTSRLWAVLHQAATDGVFVYPPRMPGTPSMHRETSSSVH